MCTSASHSRMAQVTAATSAASALPPDHPVEGFRRQVTVKRGAPQIRSDDLMAVGQQLGRRVLADPARRHQ